MIRGVWNRVLNGGIMPSRQQASTYGICQSLSEGPAGTFHTYIRDELS